MGEAAPLEPQGGAGPTETSSLQAGGGEMSGV